MNTNTIMLPAFIIESLDETYVVICGLRERLEISQCESIKRKLDKEVSNYEELLDDGLDCAELNPEWSELARFDIRRHDVVEWEDIPTIPTDDVEEKESISASLEDREDFPEGQVESKSDDNTNLSVSLENIIDFPEVISAKTK